VRRKLRALAEDLRAPVAERQLAWDKYHELRTKWVARRTHRIPRVKRIRKRPAQPAQAAEPQGTYEANRTAAQAEAVASLVKLAVDFLKFVFEPEATVT